MSTEVNDVSIIVLAAGRGSRMLSTQPKVLHEVGGLALINHVLRTATAIKPKNIAVVLGGEGAEAVRQSVIEHNQQALERIHFVFQQEANGTGGATKIAVEALGSELANNVLVIFGDTPFVTTETMIELLYKLNTIEPDKENALVVVGFEVQDITKPYGRLVLDDKETSILEIVEFKDANETERRIELCNAGIMAINRKFLPGFLANLKNTNAAREYYLTDIVAEAVAQGLRCQYLLVEEQEIVGINTRLELAQAEKIFQERQRRLFMDRGVTMIDPRTVYFSYDTEIAREVVIYPNVFFRSGVKIASGVTIFPYCFLEHITIQANAQVGPFVRTRGEVQLQENSKIGSFVDLKDAQIGTGSKVPHLSYIGNTVMGANSNIGAGTITCNYDGYNKYATKIGDNVLIGSNNSLVAPLEIGDNAITGAGGTFTRDIPADALAISRKRAKILEHKSISYHAVKSKLAHKPNKLAN